MLCGSFRIDTNKLACQMCLLRVDPLMTCFLSYRFSGRPVHDLNSLRPNPNPQKPVSGSCRVCVLGRTLTPLINTTYESVIKACFSEAPLLLVPTNVTKFPSWGENA